MIEVTFPDPAAVAEVARVEAERPHAAIEFVWFKGIAWALALGLAGSAVFAGVVYATNAQFGIISIVIGALAGIGAARGGRSRRAQIVGASVATIAYFVGQLLAVIALVGAEFFDLPFDAVARLMWRMIEQTFTTRDALFLAIAVYNGWIIPRARA